MIFNVGGGAGGLGDGAVQHGLIEEEDAGREAAALCQPLAFDLLFREGSD